MMPWDKWFEMLGAVLQIGLAMVVVLFVWLLFCLVWGRIVDKVMK